MDKYWIYWPEQCKYCQHIGWCEHKQKVENYIEALKQVEDVGVYGCLSWWCDYFMLDVKKYESNCPPHNSI